MSRSVICRACEEPVVRVGSNWYCQNTACERFTLPCPHSHMDIAETEEEHEAALERQRDREARVS